MSVFDFKEFYSIYKEALIDQELTSSVAILFEPILNARNFPNDPNKPDDTEYLEINTKRASEWTSNRKVRRDVAKEAQNPATANAIIGQFEEVIVPEELDDTQVDDMMTALMQSIGVSSAEQSAKDELQQLYDDHTVCIFLGRAFILSLASVLKSSRKRQRLPESSIESVDEFDRLVDSKRQKPKAVVPDEVDEEERNMNYVRQLLAAYEEASGDEYRVPEDVQETEYEGHFRQQRKNYYQAEAIHREIRDSIRKTEEGFDALKEEIEDGIYDVAHAEYDKGLDKAKAVLNAAGMLPISHNMDEYMLGWVGPGERRGVCHMLVNDEKIEWVENKDEK